MSEPKKILVVGAHSCEGVGREMARKVIERGLDKMGERADVITVTDPDEIRAGQDLTLLMPRLIDEYNPETAKVKQNRGPRDRWNRLKH